MKQSPSAKPAKLAASASIPPTTPDNLAIMRVARRKVAKATKVKAKPAAKKQAAKKR